MRIWVTGANGLLGSAVLKLLRAQNIPHAGSTKSQADVANLNSAAAFCRSYGPFTHIINCAAYTAVDAAESNQKEAQMANGLAPALLGLFAANANMRLIHLSTDYVFDGNASAPYQEDHAPAPKNVYGITKAEGEQRLLALVPDACVIRTSWLFGKGGKNFAASMLEKMKTQEEVHVVTDQRGKPTYVDDLAAVILKALNWSGIYHVAGSGEASRFQFAEAIREEALAQGVPLLCKRIIPVLSTEFPTAAKRPSYSVLNTEKAEKKLNASLPSWKEGLKQMVAGV